MRFGAHLPVIKFAEARWSLASLQEYARAARRLGFDFIAANDHLAFARPWLDGPTALAAVLSETGGLPLMTTVGLPVVRGPFAFAKAMAALDVISGGRVIAGVGPGSSARDYQAAGIPFEERWRRLDEAVHALRALWDPASPPFRGRFYTTEGLTLEPLPLQRPAPPIWLGSWGSEAGLRRVARLGDGWLASAYNTTPAGFAEASRKLEGMLRERGRDPGAFPNGLSTMFFHITEDRAEAEEVMERVIGPAIKRPLEQLRERLPVGPASRCAELLHAYTEAGLQQVVLWPVMDEVRQLERFRDGVAARF